MYKTDAVAILLATYQGERYLRAQLDSLLGQSEAGWKVFAHDDGSKDGTAAILREYAARDPERFCLIEGAGTGGAKNNFLFLTGQVEASYYMYCDQDDVWLPDKVEVTLRAMKELEREQGRDRPCLVHTELKVVDASLREICPRLSEYQGIEPGKLTLGRLLAQNTVTGCTMMINRALRNAMTVRLQASLRCPIPCAGKARRQLPPCPVWVYSRFCSRATTKTRRKPSRAACASARCGRAACLRLR